MIIRLTLNQSNLNLSMKDRDTWYLIGAIIAVALIVTIANNYQTLKSFDINTIFNSKQYPKSEKPNEFKY